MLSAIGLLRTAAGYALPASTFAFTGATPLLATTRLMAANAWSLFQKEQYPLVKEDLRTKDQDLIRQQVTERYAKLTDEEKAAYACHVPDMKKMPAGTLGWHMYVRQNLDRLQGKLGTESITQINNHARELYEKLPEAEKAKYESAAKGLNSRNAGLNLYRHKMYKGIRKQVEAELGPGATKSEANDVANKRVNDRWHALSADEKAAYAKEEEEEAGAKHSA